MVFSLSQLQVESKSAIEPNSLGIKFVLPKLGKFDYDIGNAIANILSYNPLSLGVSYTIEKVLDKFIRQVNVEINRYNTSNNKTARLVSLSLIKRIIQDVEYTLPPSHLALIKSFHTEKSKLFNEIKKQYSLNGIKTMLPSSSSSSGVAEIIANMSTEKSDALMGILLRGKSCNLATELTSLYKANDASLEAQQFKTFLTDHEVSYLGGGNSKNFKVVNIQSNLIKVLKVDCRLNMPRNIEAHLRSKIKSRFTAIDSERQSLSQNVSGELVSRTLLVTDFCNSGSVDAHGEKAIADGGVLEAAHNVMSQMASIFIEIQQAGCFFPDAKLTNWLVDSKDNLKLADTKSFLFSDQDGNYKPNIKGNELTGFITTRDFNPPEYNELYKFPDAYQFKVEPCHSYILGINLYYYITNFSYVKFPDGTIGKRYENLISKLIDKEPNLRISLVDAIKAMASIAKEIEHIKNTGYQKVINKLDKLVGDNNNPKFIQNYIDSCVNDITPANIESMVLSMGEVANNIDNLVKDNNKLRLVYKKSKSDYLMGRGLFFPSSSVTDFLYDINKFIDIRMNNIEEDLSNIETIHAQIKAVVDDYPKFNSALISLKNINENDVFNLDDYIKLCKSKLKPDLSNIKNVVSKMDKVITEYPKFEAVVSGLYRLDPLRADDNIEQYIKLCQNKLKPDLSNINNVVAEMDKVITEYSKFEAVVSGLYRLDPLRADDNIEQYIKLCQNKLKPDLTNINEVMLEMKMTGVITEHHKLKSIVDALSRLSPLHAADSIKQYIKLCKNNLNLDLSNIAIVSEEITVTKQLYIDYLKIGSKLKKLSVGDNDLEMDKYLKDCQAKAIPESISELVSNMLKMHEDLSGNENKKIRWIINNFRDRANLTTVGMEAKANRIEMAMSKIPIIERAKLSTSTHESVSSLKSSIDSSRNRFKNNAVASSSTTSISPQKNSTKFKKFKSKFKKKIQDLDDADSKMTPIKGRK